MIKSNKIPLLILLCVTLCADGMNSIFSWFSSKQSVPSIYDQLVQQGAVLHAFMKKNNIEDCNFNLPNSHARLAYLVYKKYNSTATPNSFIVDTCGINNLIFDIAYQSHTSLYADFNDNSEYPRGIHIKDPKKMESVAYIQADRITNPCISFNKNSTLLAFKQDPVHPKQSWKALKVVVYDTQNYQQTHIIDDFQHVFEFSWNPREENMMAISTIEKNAGTCHFVLLDNKSHKTVGSINGYHPQWNPTTAYMATTNRSAYTEEITIYDLNTQQKHATWGYENSELLETHWNSQGALLAVAGRFGDDNKRVIDIRTQDGKSAYTLPMPDGPYTHVDEWYNNFILAHVWGSDQAILWDSRNTKNPLCIIRLEQSPIIDGKINHANNDIALIPHQGDIFVYTLNGSKKTTIKWPGQNIKLALSNDGNFLSCIRLQPNIVYGGSSSPVVLTYDMSEMQTINQ